jgi:amino acid transporter
MSNEKYDISSIGKIRFGMGALISGGLALFAAIYFNPSLTQLSLGIAAGAILFVLRRSLAGKKRFQRRPTRRFGFLILTVAVLLIAYFALMQFVPELTTFTVARDFIWIYLAASLAFCFESIAGFLFYARRNSMELEERKSE